jgi:hypothetical protein
MAMQARGFLMTITTCLLVCLIIGCSPSTHFDGDTAQTVSVTPTDAYSPRATETEPNTVIMPVSPTAIDDHNVTPVSPTVVAEAISTSTPTPGPTPIMEPETPGGTLFISSFDKGFLQLSLATGKVESLVPKAENWLLWRIAVSPNQEKVAYWIHTSPTSELWLSDLMEWSPELLLSLSDFEHDAANLWWLSNDYLLLEPGVINQGYNLFVPARAYIVDVHQKQVKIEDSGFAFGCLLAPSPETEEVATWCPAKESWTNVQSYYTASASYYVVVEEAGFLWTTTESPSRILTQLRTPGDNWAWSHDRSLVAFPQYDADAERGILYYTERDAIRLYVLEDRASKSIRFNDHLPWSPDNRYLAYVGECPVRDCYRIMDVINQKITWTSRAIPDVQHIRSIIWSSDGQYIALLADEGLYIVQVETSSVIQQLSIPSGYVLAWLP